jgi:hypothetical protein
MSLSNEWLVAVFKCKTSEVKNILTDFYLFVDSLKGTRSMHFLVGDRIDDKVVFSFRIQVDPKHKGKIKNLLAEKLCLLLQSNEFAIDPPSASALGKYVVWNPEKYIANYGMKKFCRYVDLLKNLSTLVIGMVENDYFDSKERIELAHITAQMLGCTEYGQLSTSAIEIGYYDRIEDKYCSYLRQDFAEKIKE